MTVSENLQMYQHGEGHRLPQIEADDTNPIWGSSVQYKVLKLLHQTLKTPNFDCVKAG